MNQKRREDTKIVSMPSQWHMTTHSAKRSKEDGVRGFLEQVIEQKKAEFGVSSNSDGPMVAAKGGSDGRWLP